MATHVGGDAQASGSVSSTVNLIYPTGIQAGDVSLVVCGYNGGSVTPTTPAGYTVMGTPHQYSTSQWMQLYMKVCTGTETGSVPAAWSGAARTFWAVSIWRGVSATLLGYTYTDAVSLTTTDCAVGAVTGLGTTPAVWTSFWYERSSTPSTAVAYPTTLTGVDQSWNTGSGTSSGALGYNATSDTSGSVGSGTWVRNTTGSAGQISLTVALQDTAATNTTVNAVAATGTAAATVPTIVAAGAVNTNAVVATGTGTAKASITLSGGALVTAVKATASALAGVATPLNNGSVSITAVKATASSAANFGRPKRFNRKLETHTYAAHRGGDPGPEESLYAYRASYVKNPKFVGEGDMQLLSTGEVVFCHDDTIDRTASASSPYTTGNVSSFTLTQWRSILVKQNTGYTGNPDQPPGELSQWATEYGPGSAKTRIMMPEIKVGTDPATCLNQIMAAGLDQNSVIQAFTLADAQFAAAWGFETCWLGDVPDFATLAASGIKHWGDTYTSISAADVTNAHANGIQVWAYVVNTTTDRDSLLAIGVDHFFTNKVATVGIVNDGGSPAAATASAVARPPTVTGTSTGGVAAAVKGTATALAPAPVVSGVRVASSTAVAATGSVAALSGITATGTNLANIPATVTAFVAGGNVFAVIPRVSTSRSVVAVKATASALAKPPTVTGTVRTGFLIRIETGTTVTLRGYWTGSALASVTLRGQYDGTTIRPLR